ncbi:MAG: PadR family transcriptional regulator [Micropruina sp.]
MRTEHEAWATQLRKGVLELAVLGLLAGEPKYGSQLVDDLATHPELSISAGTVYPLLARLAKAGLVTSVWQESPVGPPRKYYTLTEPGRRTLNAMTQAFRAVSATVTTILEGHR